MNLPSDKSHLTALDILIELRCWLADNVEMQAAPAIVAHLPNGYLVEQFALLAEAYRSPAEREKHP